MIKRLAIAAAAGALLFALNLSSQAQEDFKPQLQKVTVNGATLYDAASSEKKTLEVDSSAPAKIVYTFVNQGAKPSEKPATVFVHFTSDGDIAIGGDYRPSTASTAWAKDKAVVDSKDVNMSEVKGKTIEVLVGLYLQDDGGDRLALTNSGVGDDLRLPVGTLKVK